MKLLTATLSESVFRKEKGKLNTVYDSIAIVHNCPEESQIRFQMDVTQSDVFTGVNFRNIHSFQGRNRTFFSFATKCEGHYTIS